MSSPQARVSRPGPPLPGRQLSQPLLAAVSAWRELGALGSEPWLTWVGSEGRAPLLRPSASLRKTDRKGLCGQRQKKEGHAGRDLLSSSPFIQERWLTEPPSGTRNTAPERGSSMQGQGEEGPGRGEPRDRPGIQTLPRTTPPPPFPGHFSVDPGLSPASVSPSTQKYMEPRSRLDRCVP